jgi:hypothetical protein
MTDVLQIFSKRDISAKPAQRDPLDGFRDKRVENRIDAESAYALRLENANCRDYYPERRR